MNHRHAALAVLVLAALATCSERRSAPPDAPPAPRAIVPSPSPFALLPSYASVADGATLPPDALVAVERCSACHADVFAQWSASAHRFSSMDNPFYAPAFQQARRDRGVAIQRWCGGCHDPALLFAGDLDGAPIDTTHERAQLGVGCVLCHSIDHLHDRTGNAAYVLSPDPIPVPARVGDGYGDARAHVARVANPVLHSAELCGACHKVSITEAVNGADWLRGQDDFDAWEQSAFGGNDLDRLDPSVARTTCQGCHMPLERATRGDAAAHEGMVRSHRFLGGHTALAAYRGDDDALARQQAMLRGVVRLDLFRAPDATGEGGVPLELGGLRAGEHATLDVVMVNDRVGHRFPGGTADVADTWVELTVLDARGRVVASSGAMDTAGRVDPDAHRLEVRPLDADGAPAVLRDPHRFRATAYDTTLPARAARIARYEATLPDGAVGPFTVRARLLHRRIAPAYYAFACARPPASQGHACPIAEPITEIASIALGASGRVASPDAVSTWQRYYDDGRAIAESIVEERVEQARGSLRRAIALEPSDARAYVEMARVAYREGRTDEAWDWLAQARARAPDAAVIPYLRAVAANDVWRHADALEPALEAHRRVPGNVAVTELAANLLGLAGRHDEARALIGAGLAIDPERAQLQNLQALELDALGAISPANAARNAYLRYRIHDEVPALRSRCRLTVPGCARETEPVHVHALHVQG